MKKWILFVLLFVLVLAACDQPHPYDGPPIPDTPDPAKSTLNQFQILWGDEWTAGVQFSWVSACSNKHQIRIGKAVTAKHTAAFSTKRALMTGTAARI